MKKFLKVLAWVGLILSIVGAIVICAMARISNVWLVVAGMLFLISFMCVRAQKKDDGEEAAAQPTKPRKKIPWRKVIAWGLASLAFIAFVLSAIFFGWWCLLPLVIFFCLFAWVIHVMEWRKGLFYSSLVLAALFFIWLGVFLITGTLSFDTLFVKEFYADKAEIKEEVVDDQKVKEQEVDDQKVKEQEVDDQKVMEQEVENQKVENSVVENQTVENQTVENQVVTNQTVTNQVVTPPTTSTVPPTTTTTPPTTTTTPPTTTTHTHKYDSKVVEPTCMAIGYTEHTCSCGHTYKDAQKGALGHDYVSKVVAPTIDAGGYTEHTCSRCGHTYKDNFTDKVKVSIKADKTAISYGEVAFITLEGITFDQVKISNKKYLNVEKLSDTCFEVSMAAEVTGYLTISYFNDGKTIASIEIEMLG